MSDSDITVVSSYLKVEEDKFKKKFKYYKSNNPKPSLGEVISVHSQHDANPKVINITGNTIEEDGRTQLLGLISQSQWRSYSFLENPGLVFIKNPFTSAGQRYWIRRCLETYPRKLNRTNLDSEMCLPDWWQECYRNGQCNGQLQKKLRWTTLGYHHNWDTKVYTDENKSNFPDDLAELSDVVAHHLGYTNFKAEAAIVNYYHMDSTLSAHTDHSEVNLEAPLLSFSFGQSAIFLIGGKDKSTEPSAIMLNSGDVVVMSKEARLCYHAVPKILPAPSSPWNDQDNDKVESCNINNLKNIINPDEIISLMNQDSAEWSRYGVYTQKSRINLNIRQVLNENQYSLSDF